MAELLNLRRFRKAQQRAEDAAAADRNRIAFGRSQQERGAEKAVAEHAARLLDGHLRNRSLSGDSEPDGERG